MTISSISSLEELNKITYHNFVENDSLTKFNNITAYLIHYGFITKFRNALLAGQNLGQFVTSLCDELGLNSYEMTISPESVSTYELYTAGFTQDCYFIPFSKKDFISSYFSNMTPQLSEVVFDLMKSTGRLVQIGSGGGKAFVLKPIQFNQTHFESLPVFSTPEQLLDIAQGAIESLKLQIKDVDYYVEKIAEKDEIIAQLTQHIVELNNKINQVYQTTWR